MATKICEQCGQEQDIENFYRRPQKNNPECRIKICKMCYTENSKETKRRSEDLRRRWETENKEREARKRTAIKDAVQDKQRRQERARELSLLANEHCPRCHELRTDGRLLVFIDGREKLHFSRYCENCTNSTPHSHYVLYCPVLGVVRYVGITCQPLKKRLARHLHGDSGTEQKRAWIEMLRAQALAPRIELIDESPNEKIALEKEQQWINYYLALGCPLTNGEAGDIQRVLDVQSGVRRKEIREYEQVEDREYWRLMHRSAQAFRWDCQENRQLEVKRWHNRSQCAYFLDTTYNQWFPHHHFARKAREYNRAIFEYRLPAGRADRRAVLVHITIAYVYWREADAMTKQQSEDIQFLLKNGIPVIGETVDPAWHSIMGSVTSLPRDAQRDVTCSQSR